MSVSDFFEKLEDAFDSDVDDNDSVETSRNVRNSNNYTKGKSLNYRRLYFWLFSIILIVVQCFLIGKWTFLTGPLTIVVLYLLYRLGKIIVDYFYN